MSLLDVICVQQVKGETSQKFVRNFLIVYRQNDGKRRGTVTCKDSLWQKADDLGSNSSALPYSEEQRGVHSQPVPKPSGP